MIRILTIAATLSLASCVGTAVPKYNSIAGKPMQPRPLNACVPANVDTPAHLNKGSMPVYPVTRVLEGQEGSAQARFTIEEDGTVSDIISESDSYEYFASHLKEAIQEWDISPAILDGEPTTVVCYFSLDYKIRR